MKTFNVPAKAEVSSENQAIFEQLEKKLGFVPNLYAYYAKNETALGDYLALQSRKSGLSAKEREVVNLAVSQVNECNYCLSAHTVLGKMNGFSNDEIQEVRNGGLRSDARLDALASFTREVALKRGKASQQAISKLFDAGYSEAQLIDIIMVVGDKTISNYIHNLTQFEIDFPLAPELEKATV